MAAINEDRILLVIAGRGAALVIVIATIGDVLTPWTATVPSPFTFIVAGLSAIAAIVLSVRIVTRRWAWTTYASLVSLVAWLLAAVEVMGTPDYPAVSRVRILLFYAAMSLTSTLLFIVDRTTAHHHHPVRQRD